MKETRLLMGMPVTVEVADKTVTQADIDAVFDYFKYIDETFSTYKPQSEIMKINHGELALKDASADMQEIFRLAEETKKQTNGYFDIVNSRGIFDPSGIVKGWAILRAAQLLEKRGFSNFFVDAGGDIQTQGKNSAGQFWQVGIQDPFSKADLKNPRVVKVLEISGEGVATSGTYLRGQHIYNPHSREQIFEDIVSLTVVGPDIYEADRFATAAFAMGRPGIMFIQSLPGFEGYMIDSKGIATETLGFQKYVKNI